VQPLLNPDGKTALVGIGKMSELQVLDFDTGKVMAKASCLEKDRFFSIGTIAPNGDVAAFPVGGKKGAPVEFRFLDARTLADRGTLVGKGDPEGYGWSTGKFTPDSKRFVVADGVGNVLLWDVAAKTIERTWPSLGNSTRQVDISADGKTAAFGWAPKADKDLGSQPDPQDLPQPRVSLFALDGSGPPRVLIAPQGGGAALAFSPDGNTLAFGGVGVVRLFDLTK
jgi:WD40 repeat protein